MLKSQRVRIEAESASMHRMGDVANATCRLWQLGFYIIQVMRPRLLFAATQTAFWCHCQNVLEEASHSSLLARVCISVIQDKGITTMLSMHVGGFKEFALSGESSLAERPLNGAMPERWAETRVHNQLIAPWEEGSSLTQVPQLEALISSPVFGTNLRNF